MFLTKVHGPRLIRMDPLKGAWTWLYENMNEPLFLKTCTDSAYLKPTQTYFYETMHGPSI